MEPNVIRVPLYVLKRENRSLKRAVAKEKRRKAKIIALAAENDKLIKEYDTLRATNDLEWTIID